MLYKNNQKYDLTDKDKWRIREFLSTSKSGKVELRLRFPDSMYTSNPNTEDPTRKDRPAQGVIPYQELIDDEETKESVTWSYTELAPTRNSSGDIVFYTNTPSSFNFSGSLTVKDNKMDLIYFLLFVSRRSAHCPNANRPVFEVVNKAKQASEFVKNKRIESDVMGSIIGTNQIDYDDILRISKAFNLNVKEEMTEDEVRQELFTLVMNKEKATKDGFALFLDLIDAEQRAVIVEALKEAIDMKIVEYSDKTNQWMLMDAEGTKKIRNLCKPVPDKTREESLRYHAMRDPEMAQIIIDAVKEAKAVIA